MMKKLQSVLCLITITSIGALLSPPAISAVMPDPIILEIDGVLQGEPATRIDGSLRVSTRTGGVSGRINIDGRSINVSGDITLFSLDLRTPEGAAHKFVLDSVLSGTNAVGNFDRGDGSRGGWSGKLRQRAAPRRVSPSIVSGLESGVAQEAFVRIRYRDLRRSARAQVSRTAPKSRLSAARAALYQQRKRTLAPSLAQHGVEVISDYSHLPTMLVRIPTKSALGALLNMPEVDAIYANRKYRPKTAQSLPLIGQPQAITQGFGGEGTIVAVLDSGLDHRNPFDLSQTLPEFGQDCSTIPDPDCKIVALVEKADDDGALDDTRHGTNAASIIAQTAPAAKILALDVIAPDGTTDYAAVSDALNDLIFNQPTLGPELGLQDDPIVAVNLSIGTSCGDYESVCSDPEEGLVQVFQDVYEAGILPIVASGNGGSIDALDHPSCISRVVRVGSVYDAEDSDGWINEDGDNCEGESFAHDACPDPSVPCCLDLPVEANDVVCSSNSADYLTLMAPGYDIFAAGPSAVAGTSFAAPHVTGAAAILRGSSAFTNQEPLDCVVSRLKDLGDGAVDPDRVVDPRNTLSFARVNIADAANTHVGFVSDCNGDKNVRINELILAVRIALNRSPLSACPQIDANGDGSVSIGELISGVNALLMGGCPFETSGNP